MRRVGDDGPADPRSMVPAPDHTHTASYVCTACGGLWSHDDERCTGGSSVPDRCACRPITQSDPEHPSVTHGRSDAGIPCSLCATCGLSVIRGHTRWKLHHCRRCLPIINGLNRAAGRLLVPIGIHSLVNRVPSPAITDDETGNRARLTAWWDQFDAMARSSQWIHEHGRALVLELVRQSHFTGHTELTVSQLRTACEWRNIDHRFGIELMLQAVLTGHDPLLDGP